jgi:class 3 adenylate cyclase
MVCADGTLSRAMTDLPSGAVTFLFTDIEGSTRLVRQLRSRYAEVLAEHQRLLRKAFSQHGGHEIDTQGDAFFYAFGSAHEAVLAAVEAQRALSGYPWPDETEVRVRIGIHTGQAAPVNGRYTGLAVHRAARICAAGHGGQVLVSQATQSLLEDEEEDLAVRMRDLGGQRLKDIERPVRLYQVAAPGLLTDFPPPRGEAPPTEALEATLARPVWRRRPVIVAAALFAFALIAAAVLLATRDTKGGLSVVRPNHVGIIDPKTNDIVDEIQVGLRPGPVAVGGGMVWIGNLDERTLTKIDAKGRTSAGTYPLDNRTPTGIAVGAGSVWVAHGALGKLAAVDPEFGQVTKTIDVAGEALGSANGSVAVGAGAVWAVYGDSTLARVDPTRLSVTGRTLTGSAPAGIVIASGYVWVVNTDSATVQRFQPETQIWNRRGRQRCCLFSVARGQRVGCAENGRRYGRARLHDHAQAEREQSDEAQGRRVVPLRDQRRGIDPRLPPVRPGLGQSHHRSQFHGYEVDRRQAQEGHLHLQVRPAPVLHARKLQGRLTSGRGERLTPREPLRQPPTRSRQEPSRIHRRTSASPDSRRRTRLNRRRNICMHVLRRERRDSNPRPPA